MLCEDSRAVGQAVGRLGAGGRTAGGFVKVEIYTRGLGGGGVGFRARGDEVWRKQEGSEWSAGG